MKKKSAKRARRNFVQNRQAVIVSEVNSASTVCTLTDRRDPETLKVEISSKSAGDGATRLFIRDGEGEYLALNGREARTVYRALQKHFWATNRDY